MGSPSCGGAPGAARLCTSRQRWISDASKVSAELIDGLHVDGVSPAGVLATARNVGDGDLPLLDQLQALGADDLSLHVFALTGEPLWTSLHV